MSSFTLVLTDSLHKGHLMTITLNVQCYLAFETVVEWYL